MHHKDLHWFTSWSVRTEMVFLEPKVCSIPSPTLPGQVGGTLDNRGSVQVTVALTLTPTQLSACQDTPLNPI